MPGFSVDGQQSSQPNNKVAPLRSHRFKVMELGPLKDPITEGLIYVRDVILPTISFDVHEQLGNAVVYKFAKVVTFDDVAITFYDVKGLYQVMTTWQKRIFTAQEGLGYAKGAQSSPGYKERTIIEVLDDDGEPDYRVVLQNSWPRAISHSELSYTSSDLKSVTVTLTYDWVDVLPALGSLPRGDVQPESDFGRTNRELENFAQQQYEQARESATQSDDTKPTVA